MAVVFVVVVVVVVVAAASASAASASPASASPASAAADAVGGVVLVVVVWAVGRWRVCNTRQSFFLNSDGVLAGLCCAHGTGPLAGSTHTATTYLPWCQPLPPRFPPRARRPIFSQSGDPIGADNPPLALPNGRVYGSRAIRALARPPPAAAGDAAAGGGAVGFDGYAVGGNLGASLVTCPSTGQKFRYDQLRSVYII